jgi:hypothetical protein
VVAAEQVKPIGEDVLSPMGKGVGGAAGDGAGVEQVSKIAVPGDLAETDDDTNFRQSPYLGSEMGRTVSDLLWERFIAGWGATNDRGDPGMAEL